MLAFTAQAHHGRETTRQGLVEGGGHVLGISPQDEGEVAALLVEGNVVGYICERGVAFGEVAQGQVSLVVVGGEEVCEGVGAGVWGGGAVWGGGEPCDVEGGWGCAVGVPEVEGVCVGALAAEDASSGELGLVEGVAGEGAVGVVEDEDVGGVAWGVVGGGVGADELVEGCGVGGVVHVFIMSWLVGGVGVGDVEEVPYLAVEFLADGEEGGEADGAGSAVFEGGEIGVGDVDAFGEFGEGEVVAGEEVVEVAGDVGLGVGHGVRRFLGGLC